MKPSLHLFDFDGTITSRDSFFELLKHQFSSAKIACSAMLLSPWLVGYKSKLVSNHVAKEKVFGHFFQGWSVKGFDDLCQSFATSKLPQIIRPKALKHIDEIQKKQDTAVIVTASIENWVKPWAKKHGLKVIGTQITTDADSLTGSFSTKNCYGPEKPKRIQQALNLDDYQSIYAYGDSRGDREMLALANQASFKPFG